MLEETEEQSRMDNLETFARTWLRPRYCFGVVRLLIVLDFFVMFSLFCPMLPVFLDCPFVIVLRFRCIEYVGHLV
jgi:hypothetical protein